MSLARLTKKEQYGLNKSEKLVMFYRQHPVEAARDLLGVELCFFQRKALRDLWFKKNNLLLMSRGIGKTWLLALFAVLYAMLYPNVKIGVITPSFKQTEFLFDKICDFYEDAVFFRASVSGKVLRTTFKAFVRFHNRSFIEGLPLGKGNKIRGRRYNVILIDEYAQVSEEIIKVVVRPMMNVKNKGIENKYIISSTAYYTWNHFYIQYLLYNVMSIRKPNLYAFHEYTVEDLKMIKDPPFEIDEEVYEMMRMDTTAELYEMENMCRFPIENVGFFSSRLIDSCTPKVDVDSNGVVTQTDSPIELIGEYESKYTMGIDAARVAGGDNFAIAIIKIDNNIKRLVHVATLNGATYQKMVSLIRHYLDIFNVVQINCDAGGGGMTIKDLLCQPFKTNDGRVLPPILDMDDKDMNDREGVHTLRMVNFSSPVVNDLYMRLKADMQHKKLLFPIDIRRAGDKELERAGNEIIETKRELLVLQAEGRGNYYKFDVPSQFKKDRATALALGIRAANEHIANGALVENVELGVGFWVR